MKRKYRYYGVWDSSYDNIDEIWDDHYQISSFMGVNFVGKEEEEEEEEE